MLTASIVVDLAAPSTETTTRDDRHRLASAQLGQAPDGTRVVVLIGSRQWDLSEWAVRELHNHADRLVLDIRGNNGSACARWHAAVRAGSLELGA